jgi:hypothetical protein
MNVAVTQFRKMGYYDKGISSAKTAIAVTSAALLFPLTLFVWPITIPLYGRYSDKLSERVPTVASLIKQFNETIMQVYYGFICLFLSYAQTCFNLPESIDGLFNEWHKNYSSAFKESQEEEQEPEHAQHRHHHSYEEFEGGRQTSYYLPRSASRE